LFKFLKFNNTLFFSLARKFSFKLKKKINSDSYVNNYTQIKDISLFKKSFVKIKPTSIAYLHIVSSSNKSTISFHNSFHKLVWFKTNKRLYKDKKFIKDLQTIKSFIVDSFKEFLLNKKNKKFKWNHYIVLLHGPILKTSKIFFEIIRTKMIRVLSVVDRTGIPHNGCRPSKKRRKKVRNKNKLVKKNFFV